MKRANKVFISTTTFAEYSREPLTLLKSKGIDYRLNPYKRKLTEEEILRILQNDSYVGLIAGTEALTGRVLENAPALKIISRVGVGLDNVDLKTAKRLKIKVYNTPDVLTEAVAELTIGLIICALRKIVSMDRKMHKRIWDKEMGLLLKGKTLGIIGFGRIGRQVAQIASIFGTRIIFYDVSPVKFKPFKKVSLNNLLGESDIISLHSSAKDVVISGEAISRMKEGAILVNTARSSSIDEDVLYKALMSGKISAAALDVYTEEPYAGKLTNLDNVILTPHIGSYAKEARVAMEIEAAENLIKGLHL